MLGIQRATGVVAVQFFKRTPYKKSSLPSGFRISSNMAAAVTAPTNLSAASGSEGKSSEPLSSSKDTSSTVSGNIDSTSDRPKSKKTKVDYICLKQKNNHFIK